MNMLSYLIVFLGAGLGGAARHGVNGLISAGTAPGFPYGILFINITGSFLLGALTSYFGFKGEASGNLRLLLTTGFCGGYTTFSTFSQDTILLAERGQGDTAALYVALSVVLSLAAFFIGYWGVKQMTA